MLVKSFNDINVRITHAENEKLVGKFLLVPNSIRKDVTMAFSLADEVPSETPWQWNEEKKRFMPSPLPNHQKVKKTEVVA